MNDVEYGGYGIVSDGTFGFKRIKSIGPGKLPKELRGSFSTTDIAKRAIDFYVDVKGNKNGKESSAS